MKQRPFGGIVCLLAIALTFAAGDTQAAPITIDNFDNPNPGLFFIVPSGLNPSQQISQTVAGVIGGQRDSLFRAIGQAAAPPATGFIGFDNDFSETALQFGTVGLLPAVATLLYDGSNNANPANGLTNARNLGGGLGVDLTGGGTNDRFQLQFISSDAQPTPGLDVVITITSPSGTSTVTKIAPNAQAPFNVIVPFNQLVGSASLTQVDSITVAFNSVSQSPNIDFELSSITAVPEPAGLLMMALGGAIACSTTLLRHRRCPRR